MKSHIRLSGGRYEFSRNDLPLLISYREGTGGSQFSVSLIADLFANGEKILFLTAYPMAREQFLNQIPEDLKKNTAFIDSGEAILNNKNMKGILLDSGNQELFMNTLSDLPNIDDRIIFVKNIETFSDELILKCLNYKNIILSGNIDKCTVRERLASFDFQTTILFSQPDTKIPFNLPELTKYEGYMWGQGGEGVIKLVEQNAK